MAIMKRTAFATCLALLLAATAAAPAAADCFADYKAKRDNPLQLHYGVARLPEAACDDIVEASADIARRLATDRWTLLNVMGIFGPDGLAERQADAGEYYLRY